MATGQAVINFGAFPGSIVATVAVSGQAGILGTAMVEAWFPGVATSDHTANDHAFVPLFVELTVGAPVAGTGFTITAASTQKMQGTFNVNWVWA